MKKLKVQSKKGDYMTTRDTVQKNNKDTERRVRLASRLAIIGAGGFIALLGALHFIEPEFDPSWRMISEYALGGYGWMMVLAFLSFTIGSYSLFVALQGLLKGKAGIVGRYLLLSIGTGALLGAIFITDPITSKERSAIDIWHDIGGTLCFLVIPFATLLISFSLRHNEAWARIRMALYWLTALIWLSIVSLFVISSIQYRGEAGPHVFIGWPNRAVMVLYCVWVIIMARQIIRIRTRQ